MLIGKKVKLSADTANIFYCFSFHQQPAVTIRLNIRFNAAAEPSPVGGMGLELLVLPAVRAGLGAHGSAVAFSRREASGECLSSGSGPSGPSTLQRMVRPLHSY